MDARKAPESLFLVQFSRFFDSSTGQISEPLLDTLDRLYTANISLLLKAYLQQEIFKITEMRPAEWGTLFSPSACDNASKLQQLTQGALTQFDWLRPGRWTDRIPALRSFYQSSKASYRAEAEAWLRVFQHMASPGFVFAGHITAERKLHLSTGRPLAGGIAGITPEGHPIFLTIEEALAPAMSGSQSRLRELRSPDLFAEHSPILMLATLPDQAAKLTRFPAGTPLPQNGWLRFTFMTQEQIQNQQENSHKQSVQTSAEPEQAAPTLANAEPSTEPPPAPADDTLR